MEKRKLTAAAAWRRIARAFRGPQNRLTENGLCFAIQILEDNREITERTAVAMGATISKCRLPRTYLGAWLWPKTTEYRLHRARLAEKFARAIERRKKR